MAQSSPRLKLSAASNRLSGTEPVCRRRLLTADQAGTEHSTEPKPSQELRWRTGGRLTKLPFVDIPGWVALPRALLGPGQVRGEDQGGDGEEEGYRHEIAAVELDDVNGCRAPLRRRQGHTKSFDQAVQFGVGVAVPGGSAPLVFRARNI